MKKTVVLLLTLAMLLSLSACSLTFLNRYDADPPPEDPKSQTGTEQEKTSPAPEAPDQPEPPVQGESQGEEPVPPEAKDPQEPAADPEDPVYEVRVSHTDVTLFSPGETFRLTVWDSNGKDPDTCAYTSADLAVAAVDEAGGEVTAVAPGTTTVTVHAEFGEEAADFDCIVRCNWKEEDPGLPASGAAEAPPSLSDFFATLQSQYEGLGAMMVMEGELLENYYPGLSAIPAVKSVLIQETMISVANVAVGLVELSGDATLDDILAVQEILQARITAQADGGAWYPESCETWGQGVITSASNRVGMFVYPENAQAMADLFTATYSN